MLPESVGLNIHALEQTLQSRYLTTSYKLFWVSALLTEVSINNACSSVSFDRMIARMVAAAWYPIELYHLNLGVYDRLASIIEYLRRTPEFSHIHSENDFVELFERRLSIDTKLQEQTGLFSRYVPYRFLTPFYSKDLVRLPDSQKNLRIVELAGDGHGIYKFGPNEIVINPQWLEYIYRNIAILKGWTYHKLTLYLQQRNPNVPGIAMKLFAPKPGDRNLRIATHFWQKVMEKKKLTDIYTGAPIGNDSFERYGQLSIDHFIPWSFVLHNQLWNLVPSFQKINSSKNDKLPDLTRYIDSFCQLQYEAYSLVRTWPNGAKILEEYTVVAAKSDQRLLSQGCLSYIEFAAMMKQAIAPIHQIALNQGYEIWLPPEY